MLWKETLQTLPKTHSRRPGSVHPSCQVLVDSLDALHPVGAMLHTLSVHPHPGNVPGGQVP